MLWPLRAVLCVAPTSRHFLCPVPFSAMHRLHQHRPNRVGAWAIQLEVVSLLTTLHRGHDHVSACSQNLDVVAQAAMQRQTGGRLPVSRSNFKVGHRRAID